jgi:hypothetical protein
MQGLRVCRRHGWVLLGP